MLKGRIKVKGYVSYVNVNPRAVERFLGDRDWSRQPDSLISICITDGLHHIPGCKCSAFDRFDRKQSLRIKTTDVCLDVAWFHTVKRFSKQKSQVYFSLHV